MLSLEQALAELPDTAAGIALYLHERGIKGIREDDCACPLANYLIGLGFTEVKVDRVLIEVYSERHHYYETAVPSDAVRDFIRRFDFHAEWPTLVSEAADA